jgi:hypothetical protein
VQSVVIQPGVRTRRLRWKRIAAGAAVLLLIALVSVVWWASAIAPLGMGSDGWGARGLGVAPHTADPNDTGPPQYLWRRGGSYTVSFSLTNSSRVPITITGIAGGATSSASLIETPTLMAHPGTAPFARAPFRPLTIPAGSSRSVLAVFRANDRACGTAANTGIVVEGLTLRYTALRVFHNAQFVPIPGEAQLHLSDPTPPCS